MFSFVSLFFSHCGKYMYHSSFFSFVGHVKSTLCSGVYRTYSYSIYSWSGKAFYCSYSAIVPLVKACLG